jgi:hypothetical protein
VPDSDLPLHATVSVFTHASIEPFFLVCKSLPLIAFSDGVDLWKNAGYSLNSTPGLVSLLVNTPQAG